MTVAWEVEFTSDLEAWWDSLSEPEQEDVDACVRLLQELGPALRYPHSSGVATSRHPHMRELRIQHQGRPYRILYAFDPLRTALLLLGGDKTGQDRWHETLVPRAGLLYDQHLEELSREDKV